MIQTKIKDLSAPIFGRIHHLHIGITGALLGSAAVGSVGNVVGSLIGKSSSSKQLNNQMKLNAQQQKYADINATMAYKRQRALTEDTVALQKKGMQKAGLSTAGMTGSGSTPTVQQASPASGGAAPDGSVGVSAAQGFVNAATSAAKLYLEGSATLSDNAKKTAETQLLIQDLTEKQKTFDIRFQTMMSQSKSEQFKAEMEEMRSDMMNLFGYRIQAAEADIADARVTQEQAQATYAYETKIAELRNLDAEYDNILARTDLTNEERKLCFENQKLVRSQILTEATKRTLNLSYAGQANAMTKGITLDNAFKDATFEARKRSVELDNEGKVLSNIGQKFTNGGLFLSNEFAKKTFDDRANEIKYRNENIKSNTGYVNSLKSGQDVKNLFDTVTFGDRASEIHHRSNLIKLKGAYLLKKMNDGSEVIYNGNDDEDFSFNVGNLLKKSKRLGFKSLKYLPRL